MRSIKFPTIDLRFYFTSTDICKLLTPRRAKLRRTNRCDISLQGQFLFYDMVNIRIIDHNELLGEQI